VSAAATPAGARGDRRIAGIDGLRGLAAYAILVFHAWLFSSPADLGWNLGPLSPFMPPLQAGVTLFFVLSGFLLYRPIVASILGGRPSPSVRRYLWNRFLRIFPAYWVILLVTSLLLGAAVLEAGDGGLSVGPLYDPLLLVQNAFLVAYYRPETLWTGIIPTWSLSIELAFYLCLPLLGLVAALVAARARSERGRLYAALVPVAVLVAVATAGKLAAVFLVPGPGRSQATDWHTVLDRSFLTHADLFAFGMIVALASVAAAGGHSFLPSWIHGPYGGRILLYVGLPFGVVGYYFVSAYLYEPVVAAALALVLIRVAVGRPDGGRGRLAALLDSRPAVGLGTISYSVFLWNYPVLIFLQIHGLLLPPGGAPAVLANLAIALVAVTAVAIVTYRFVEAPALGLKTDPVGRARRGAARLRASAASISAGPKLGARPRVEPPPAASPSD
jgi:peptidoglycan/LPS O-acetylase OafA/YrhL